MDDADTPSTMHLPDPTLTLTLPSLHDGTPLDCRVYLPPSVLAVASGGTAASSATTTNSPPRWRGHAAVVAHPYAPMGGSYNDPIVKMVAQTLLQRSPSLSSAAHTSSPGGEFVVATFNFRGAGRKPQGRTSWTAKPETGDYMTIAGFLYYFAHYLDPYGEKEGHPPTAPTGQVPTFLFAGYSYGAMVTSLLPPLATILGHFTQPLRGAPAAEVRLRAARWAAIQNADFAACRELAASASKTDTPCSPASSPTKTRRSEARLSMGIRVGGAADDDGHWRRRSHEVRLSSGGSSSGGGTGIGSGLGGSMRHMLSTTSPRRSLSGDHRRSNHAEGNGHAHSHMRSQSGSGHGHGHSGEGEGNNAPGKDGQRGVAGWVARVRHSSSKEVDDDHDEKMSKEGGKDKSATMPAAQGLPTVRPAYLLVSPPVGLATNLATMSFSASLTSGGSGGGFFKRKTAKVATATSQSSKVDGSADEVGAPATAATTDDKLAANPTLIVYGDADGFTSAKKMRQWTAGLAAASAASASTTTPTAVAAAAAAAAAEPARPRLFRALEVPTAGHFWAEGRTLYELQEAVDAFAAEIVRAK